MFRFMAGRSGFPGAFGRVLRYRFSSTLAFVETDRTGGIAVSSLSALKAATQLGNPITALLVGSSTDAAVGQLNELDCPQLKKIMVAKNAVYENYLPERVTPLCVELLKDQEYSHFIVSASAVGKNILPRIGALLDVQPVNDVITINNNKTFVRPIYAGNALITVEDTQSKVLISVRSSSFDMVASGSNDAVVEEAPVVEVSDLDVKWEGASLVQSERPDLGSAVRVVSGGRGLKNKETFEKLVQPLADALGAGIGATRAAVDAGFCDNSLQVGQTGKIIAPDLYVAVGLSGAIQHLAGMKDSKTIVAINKDPEAPIFQIADYGLVGDLNEIIPRLTEKLKQ
ncbi:Aim45p Ecym_7273 [Eremothecium cymbalariae DBVPG|uniref:Probable electron transfer flavoprotein subunit alpha n=1 Tax=Eremothecium cymbalariae (strain CBS 270.75 / DBVPG 7215 / KCTC 17166 / NRRL Y-17582) TaxID=931890 RepID=G8JWA0_ERECY|nr:hypothetical protein Ecym_7273 [Eremothecium cymbalariae DBVPG\